MSGETNLSILLQNMNPILHAEQYGYGTLPLGSPNPTNLDYFAVVKEPAAITVVATIAELAKHDIDHIPGWARISLEIHSDLSGVGLTAVISAASPTRISAPIRWLAIIMIIFSYSGQGGMKRSPP
jgi:uncharacterized protein